MRVLEYTGPWSTGIVDVDEPVAPPGWAVVDVVATGICGSDAHGYTGDTGRRAPGQVMGHETVGLLRDAIDGPGGAVAAGAVVTFNPMLGCGACEACAAGETQICPSLRVFGVDPALPGSFADALLVPVGNVVPLGAGMPVLHGALVEPLAVGYHAVMRGLPRPDDTVVVIGGGPIGQAAAIGAGRAGAAQILVSEPVAQRREVLARLGFDAVAPEDLAGAVRARFGSGASLVVDAVGLEASVSAAVEVSRPGARVVLVGMGAKEMRLLPYGFSGFERSLVGSYCYSDAHFRETAAWVAAGRPELDALIDEVLPLESGDAAFASVARGGAGTGSGKTLLASRAVAGL